MITRNATAILAAIFLVTICNSQTKASINLSQEFCGDKYCASSYQKVEKKAVKVARQTHKIKKHKEKKEKRIRIDHIENKFTHDNPSLLKKAAGYLGTNPTGWKSLWCARFIAVIAPSAAERLKRMGLNPNWARDYAELPGAKRTGGKPGDLVILTRGEGGHIGVLKAFDKRGNPIIISGNHGHKVGTGVYSKSRVIAYASV